MLLTGLNTQAGIAGKRSTGKPITVIAVSSSSFGRNIKESLADSLAVTSAILLFLIRFVIVMVPIFVLIILPGGLLARYLFRRAKNWQSAREVPSSSDSN